MIKKEKIEIIKRTRLNSVDLALLLLFKFSG